MIYWVFVGMVVFWFALFPWAAADDYRLHRRARATLETSGVESYRAIVTVVSYVEPQSGDNPGDFWGIQYSYEAGGTTRRGSRSFKKKPTVEVGDPLPIVYDPDHPEIHAPMISRKRSRPCRRSSTASSGSSHLQPSCH